jgi:hypothetical protein
LNRSWGEYLSLCKKRFTLSCEIPITSDKRQQLGEFGSLNKNSIYIGNVQRAVEGRLISRIMARHLIWLGFLNKNILQHLSMRKS